jgi:hypothetical protein
MKRFDENDVAKRLGAPTPPPPPDLGARIRAEIPERVEVPPALTRPPGTLPFLRRPLGRRLVALAAILVVGIAANLVARRVMRPAPGPLEVALVAPTPAPGGQAAPPAADAAATLQREPAPAVQGPAVAPEAAERLGKGRREAAAAPARPAQPQVAAEAAVASVEPAVASVEPAVAAPPTAPAAVVGGVLAPAAGEVDEGRGTPRPGFIEVRTRPRLDTLTGMGAREKAPETGQQAVADRFEARQASLVAPAPAAEVSLAPAPTGDTLLLLLPPGTVVALEPTSVARYRSLPGTSSGAASIVELVTQQELEPDSPVLTVEVQPGRGPVPADGSTTVLRRADAAASFRAASRALRLAYLEARLADVPEGGAAEAAILLAEAEALAAEDPGDGAAQALRGRWQAAAGTPPPRP